MVGVIGVLCGYLAGTIWPSFMSASNPGPAFMMLIAIVFAFGVAYIAYRGVVGATSVNIAINVIQITALIVFSVLALGYRMNHPAGSEAWQFDSQSGDAYKYEFATTKTIVDGKPTDTIVRDKDGIPQPQKDASGKPVPYKISYPATDEKGNFLSHPDAASVVGVHNLSWMFMQAAVAILILVGFESVTSMGGEAKNAKRDIPIAVITSLLVQGAFCYLFEYFAGNYVLNSGYTMQSAGGSSAPIGDLMILVGNALLGPGNGKIFMEVEAFTVFLALIGTTLSCMSTGARVTYAMGRDQEVPEHFGMLHAENLTPHRAIWALAGISALIGCIAVIMPFGDAGAPADAAIKSLPQGFFSSFGYSTHDAMAKMPNSLLTMTLASNFGTFLLYMLSCITCIVGFRPSMPQFSMIRHRIIPVLGLIANLACMMTYIIAPFLGMGTTKEPLLALGIAMVWAIYGGIYFVTATKQTGRTTLIKSPKLA
jgi:amino acid transporter